MGIYRNWFNDITQSFDLFYSFINNSMTWVIYEDIAEISCTISYKTYDNIGE